MGKPVVIAVVGRSRHEQQVIALVREPFGKLVALGALDFVSAAGGTLRVGAALVRFVDDDEIPRLLPHSRADFVLFGVVDGCDDLPLPLPEVQKLLPVVRGVNDPERLVEEAQQFVLPLDGQWRGDEDEASINRIAQLQFLDQQARQIVLPTPGSSARRNRRRGWGSIFR